MAVSPDGRALATAAGNVAQFWDTTDGRPLRTWDWGVGPLQAIAVAPNGLTAAAGGDRGRVVVWDVDE